MFKNLLTIMGPFANMYSPFEKIEDRSSVGIAGATGRMITSGLLVAGDRLPTVRQLAAELRVSPATISHAWTALAEVGMIETRGRAGTFVCDQSVNTTPRRVRRLAGNYSATTLDLSRGTPDPLLLPALGPALSRVSTRADTDSYHDAPVVAELEVALAQSWPYLVQTITVVDGAMDAIARSLNLLVRYGDRVVVENPTFPPFIDLIQSLGAKALPVALDEHGIRPAAMAIALKSEPVAVLLQPRAHNPTGTSMNFERAAELAKLLRDSTAVVIEDDHSGEISTSPDVSLGSYLPDQVIHVRSFSKSHGPDLRIAALGGPSELVDRIVTQRMLGPGWTSRMLQTILHELLTNGDSMAEVNEARLQYHSRQENFGKALAMRGIELRHPDGLNAWLPVEDERSALVQLAAGGINVAAGSSFLLEPQGPNQFIRVTVAMLRKDIEQVADAFAAAATIGNEINQLGTRWS